MREMTLGILSQLYKTVKAAKGGELIESRLEDDHNTQLGTRFIRLEIAIKDNKKRGEK